MVILLFHFPNLVYFLLHIITLIRKKVVTFFRCTLCLSTLSAVTGYLQHLDNN